jgi:hypothetical protein
VRSARHPRSRRSRAARGAALVEYSLLLVLFCLASTAAIDQLTDAGGDKLSTVSGNIGDPPKVSGVGVGISTTAAPATTGPAPTTTTAVPTTTTTSTTTTTIKPTTTTKAPTTTTSTTTSTTTTTIKATKAGAVLSGATMTQSGKNDKKWAVEVTATVRDNLNKPVANATVTVEVVIMKSNGTELATVNLSGTTNASGVVTLTANGTNDNNARVSFTVTNLTGLGSLSWDGWKSTDSAWA